MALSRLRTVVLTVSVLVVPAAVIVVRDALPDADVEQIAATARSEVELDTIGPIVFAANDKGDYRLYSISSEGNDRASVTSRSSAFPRWAADGRSLAFVADVPNVAGGQKRVLEVVRERGVGTVMPSGSQVPSHPTFRTDKDLYFQATARATVGNAGILSTASIQRITAELQGPQEIQKGAGADYHPSWSPDGSQLAFVRADRSCNGKGICRQQLLVRSADGQQRTLVANGVAANPAWSPDGSRIAYTWQTKARSELWVLEVETGRRTQVTRGYDDLEPSWSADGQQIVFTRACDLQIVSVEDGEVKALTATKEVCEASPTWRPSGPV
ncbi:TolB family protein [Aeromicrobium sp. P5_D10]